jgi:protein-S-isoprenylcysteine O-methyltransferase Ste14
MKGKYVLILWAEAVAIPVLLGLMLSSLGLPMSATFLVIAIVLTATLGITIRHIIREERANRKEPFDAEEAIMDLKQKERIVMTSFFFSLTIGAILFLVSVYYSVETMTSGSIEIEKLRYLSLLGNIGSFLFGFSIILAVLWAHLRDKQKKMKDSYRYEY